MKLWGACSLAFLLTTACFSAGKKADWVLEKSEISYTVTHPLHVVHGKSSSARGKGVCYGGHCDFLVAVPVNTFDSGDNNRDLHMLEVTKAGLYPLIEVNAETAEINPARRSKQVEADLEVSFAGKKVNYPKIQLHVEWKSGEARITGVIPLNLKDFEIQPPSLLTMPIHDEVPVKLDMTWKHLNLKEEKKN